MLDLFDPWTFPILGISAGALPTADAEALQTLHMDRQKMFEILIDVILENLGARSTL